MSWGPVASQLCLLSQLKERSVGDKVRFLGWYVYNRMNFTGHHLMLKPMIALSHMILLRRVSI